MKRNQLLLIVAAIALAVFLLRRTGPVRMPWNSSPITVIGGHYGGGQ